jgi:hypothetical protein
LTDNHDDGVQINRLRERVARLEAMMDAADKALHLKERATMAAARAQSGLIAATVAALISLASNLILFGLRAH